MTTMQCPDPLTWHEIDTVLEELTKHGMVAAGVCRCGGQWPCTTALDLAAQATRACGQMTLWQNRL